MRTVLLTGHRGYIGRVMAGVLRRSGWDVVGLDAEYFTGCDLEPARDVSREIRKDIRDVEVADLRGMDAVVHLAGLSNDPLGDLSPKLTEDINRDASIRLAKLAKQAGVRRFVFSSSCSVYGVATDDAPLTETGALNPATEYARSKIEVEKAVTALADAGFHPTYMRNATVYGFSPNLRLDLVLNNLTAYARLTGVVTILSDGTPWRPLVHVRDLSRAFAAVLDAPESSIHDACFNVGAVGNNFRVAEIAEAVRDVVPGSRIEIKATASSDERTYRVDFSKFARAFPGFKFEWDLRKGAAEVDAGLRALGADKEALTGDRFFRLKWVRRLMSAGELDGALRWRDAAGVR